MKTHANQKHNWEELYTEFKELRKKNPDYTQIKFAKDRNLPYSYLSAKFAPFNEKYEREELKDLISNVARLSYKKINTFLRNPAREPETFEDAERLGNIASKAADRVGLSPQVAQTIALQNNLQVNIVVPLFESSEESEVKKILED